MPIAPIERDGASFQNGISVHVSPLSVVR